MSRASEPAVTAKIVQSIAEIPAAEWDACAGTVNPFVSHAFLLSLEESGCVGRRSGWGPVHLVVEDRAGGLAGCAPLYLKSHSRGEYIFDYGWADAYERAGGRYYPKLLSAVPFTPATGPRLLTRPGPEAPRHRRELAAALIAVAEQLDIATVNVNFLADEDWQALAAADFLLRSDQQFHWYNEGYGSFDDFLGALSSRKRKTIRKERRAAQESDIEIRVLTGSEIGEEHWDAFFEFYMDTGSRKWGTPYLNRTFFRLVGERMAERIALEMCRRAGRWVAGALNFIGEEALFGRYWGCVEDHRFLHFEACYYQAIDYAIAHGLKRVEAGAQGPHKIARGYLPTLIHSAHYIRDPGFRRAVAQYLEHERREVDQDAEYLAEHAPYRRGERPALD
ncbi:MAG TPA: GNAT family N-acetyltransferase [Alphaproteobacteria bacterium]|nr:GNAT family N-acetyltransferase [Alphaproteobacteria bacterium]